MVTDAKRWRLAPNRADVEGLTVSSNIETYLLEFAFPAAEWTGNRRSPSGAERSASLRDFSRLVIAL